MRTEHRLGSPSAQRVEEGSAALEPQHALIRWTINGIAVFLAKNGCRIGVNRSDGLKARRSSHHDNEI
jgi:hypothetical protein